MFVSKRSLTSAGQMEFYQQNVAAKVDALQKKSKQYTEGPNHWMKISILSNDDVSIVL